MQVTFLYATAVLIWGSTWIAITFQLGTVAEEVSVAYRFGLGSIALFAYAAVAGRRTSISLETYGHVALMGVLMYSGSYMLVYHATSYVTSGLVAVIFSLIVVCNAFFERLFFRKPLERRMMLASALGVGGVAFLFWPRFLLLIREIRQLLALRWRQAVSSSRPSVIWWQSSTPPAICRSWLSMRMQRHGVALVH